MNAKRIIAIAVSILVASVSVTSYAQGGSSSASQATSSKTADRALQKRVRAALAKNKDVTSSNITVRARGGNVVLQGSVADQDESQSAEEVAKSVAGVASVKNALTIRAPGQ